MFGFVSPVLKRRIRNVFLLLVAAVLGLWLLCFAYLWLLGDEGSLPSTSRMPELPPGASVVRQGHSCGSGGCWRTFTVSPAQGQSPKELADELRLAKEVVKPPTLFDPGFVYLGSTPRDSTLIVYFGYRAKYLPG